MADEKTIFQKCIFITGSGQKLFHRTHFDLNQGFIINQLCYPVAFVTDLT